MDPPAYVLVNRVHPQATKSADAVKHLIAEKSGLRVCPVHLSRRDIFEHAPATGQSAQEIDVDTVYDLFASGDMLTCLEVTYPTCGH